ncbi:transglutaminase domain-containing protein [Nonomuraea wenchangensis]|uniref:transglutaminase domain-containing protein n=1 Tax=Nonomuraea wenchangensis TaxID=568860 RepID=UPI0037145701
MSISGAESAPYLAATPILDHDHPRVLALAAEARAGGAAGRGLLVAAHRLIAARVRPVYALDDEQPASRTLRRARGSCSQRLAVLEAVSRACGIPTRVRGLLVDGRFWHARFPLLRPAVPDLVVLAWPEFRPADGWLPVSELYGDLDTLREAAPFTNTGAETLFDAVARTAVDWDGGGCSACDLSGHVRADLGRYVSRDALFLEHGQTVCRPVRFAVDPVMSRYAASAGKAN